LFIQFDPLFTYKKQKDGNYTFGGLVYQIMNDAKNYFDLRWFLLWHSKTIKQLYFNIIYFGNSYKFIIIDEAEVTKIGLIAALLKHLDNKVYKTLNLSYTLLKVFTVFGNKEKPKT